jgi:Tfp pilus assembly protein PilO
MQIDLKNRQQVLLLTALTVVGLFIANLIVFTPLANAWKTRADRLATLRKQVAQGIQLQQRQASLRSRWEQIRRNTLPNDNSAAEQQVFNAIENWKQSSGATVTAINPQWKHDADDYMSYQCRLDAAGDLSVLSKFLYALEQDPIALKLESVELGTRDKQGQQLTLAIQFNGLVLTPQTK